MVLDIKAENGTVQHRVISADCHIDLIWLPPDLFTSEAPAALKERMPYVEEREDGLRWVSRDGADFGLVNGMGSAGRSYVPGQIQRSDRMAATGLYDDGKRGIRRLTDPILVKDQTWTQFRARFCTAFWAPARGWGTRRPATRCCTSTTAGWRVLRDAP